MRRYRYISARIHSPHFGGKWIRVYSVSDGLIVLRAVGAGELMLEAPAMKCGQYLASLHPRISIDRLQDKTEDEIWQMFDTQTDIDRALQATCTSRASRGNGKSWDHPPAAVKLNDTAKQRLRHFAALMIADIRIGDHTSYSTREDAAAADAGLRGPERLIATKYTQAKRIESLLELS